METIGNWMAWLSHGAVWLLAVWFLVACAIGIPCIIRDEIKLRRTAPKPAEVAAYADRMEAVNGRGALSVVGQAMMNAQEQGDFQTRRLLKEVSGELVRRVVERNRLNIAAPSAFAIDCTRQPMSGPDIKWIVDQPSDR